jgi:uncharacterized protein HemX
MAGIIRAGSLSAQEPATASKSTDGLEPLRKQILEMQASLQQMQTQHQQEVAALKASIDTQQTTIEELQKTVALTTPPPLPGVRRWQFSAAPALSDD